MAYVVGKDRGDRIRALPGKVATEVFRAEGAAVIGGAAVSPDREWLAFAVHQSARRTSTS